MYSLQQQYNLVPGNYAKEMASVSVFPHVKSMAMDMGMGLRKTISHLATRAGHSNRKKQAN